MSKKITKHDVINYFLKKHKIGDINEKLAVDATHSIPLKKFYPYSMMHYQTAYLIIKSKLETLPTNTTKIAYIDCLILNFETLPSDNLDQIINFLDNSMPAALFGISLISAEILIIRLLSGCILVLKFLKSTHLTHR